VSVTLTPEIYINKASSNSRLTAVGRWATASDRHSQNYLQTLFSPFLWWHNNRTTPGCWKTYWNCIAFEFGTLCGAFLYCFVLFGFFHLWWDNNRTTSETPSPGLEAEGLTPKLLKLILNCIWTWRIFYFFIFIFYFIYLFSQSSLCLSNDCSVYCWLVHYLSLFISLKLLFVCLVFSLVCLFVFPSICNFFAFPLLSPFHSKYHHCYYYKLENT
jgi:hypothetical protein